MFFYRGCRNLEKVVVIAKEVNKNPEFISVLSKAKTVIAKLTFLRNKRQNNGDTLKACQDTIKSCFREIRENVNRTMDRLEASSINQMLRLHSELETKLQNDIDASTHLLDNLQGLLNDMKIHKEKCETFAFQAFKKCQQKLLQAENLLSFVSYSDLELKFRPDQNLRQFLSSLETLGELKITQQFPAHHVYTSLSKRSLNVRTNEMKTCSITGMCQLSNTKFAIVDKDNRKVKLFSTSTLNVLDETSMSLTPYDICYTRDTELAVTLHNSTNNFVQFITVNNAKMVYTRAIKLMHECRGIACHSGKLFIGSWKTLYIHDLTGQLIRKLYEDQSICRFTISDDGLVIYVTNFEGNSLIRLDSFGRKLFKFTDPELECSTAVCLADNGTVFVCGRDSNNVLQVDAKGRKLAIFSKGTKMPGALCYDKTANQLLVGSLDSDNISIFTLK